MRSLRDLFQEFPCSRERGLNEQEIAASLQRYGANRLTPLPREPVWRKFLGKFDDVIIRILLAATLLKTVVDLFECSTTCGGASLIAIMIVFASFRLLHWNAWLPAAMFGIAFALVGVSVAIGHPSWEGLAVMVAVVLATGVAFISEYQSDKEFQILNAQKESLRVKVLRGDEFQTVPMEEIVVGDVIALEMGDEVPADGRLIKANELYIDQSLMTGESEPIRKLIVAEEETAEGPDQPGCLYRGTQVADGAGLMVAAEVGDMTMIGQIARRLSAAENREANPENATSDTSEQRVQNKLTISKVQTPLQGKLEELARLISRVGYAAAIAIFVALLVRGLVRGDIGFSTDPNALRSTTSNLLDYFVYMVIVIVVAVPEGLPMSVTVSLALAMRKMTRANSLVRQLVACETIGSATIICSDKTGTLTQNKMLIDRLYLDGHSWQRERPDWPVRTARPTHGNDALGALALNCALNSTANLEKKERRTAVVGNSTEGALLQWLTEAGFDYAKMRGENPVLYQMHFSSERKRMMTVIEYQGVLTVLVKGAPEVVLDNCTRHVSADGRTLDLDVSNRQQVDIFLKNASHDSMRTLAFACRPLPPEMPRDEDAIHARRADLEKDLLFIGCVAIRDPLRPDVKEAMQQCREAGIEVMMITGDNLETASAVSREIGLLDRTDSLIVASADFNAMTDEEAKKQLPRMKVLARARPLDKLRVVQLLQDLRHVVAVTGDGTNDAPALKKADVGLSMGSSGTEVAKEASKIVLLDDSFATILKAVHWGRSLYENIQRFIQFQLTINVSALAIAFLGPFLGVKPPFTVLQLLWINVIMDTFAAIALCSEPPRPGLMKVKPKQRDEKIVTPGMRRTIVSTAAFFVVVMLALLVGMRDFDWFKSTGEMSKAFPTLTLRQTTIFFTAYVFFQVWNQINCRSLVPERSGLRRLYANPMLLAIAATIVAGQFVIVSTGGHLFEVEPLSPTDWLFIAAATSSVLVFAEIVRKVQRRA